METAPSAKLAKAAYLKNLRIFASSQDLGNREFSGAFGIPPMHLIKTGSTSTEVSMLKNTPTEATTPNS